MWRTSSLRTSSRRSCALALLGALSLGLACARPERPLRVGANVWPGYEPLYLAGELGHYRGRSIQLFSFSSATEVIRAYRNGLIDVAALTADEALLASRGREGDRIVLVCDFSAGADALVARPQIGSLAELRGKRVGVETTAVGAYLLARGLERGGLATSEVQVVSLPRDEQPAAMATGTVDAVVTFEPHRSRILATGARQLFDSSQIPGEIVDLLLARPGLDPSQERALAALVAGWFQALAQLQASPEAAATFMARREAVSREEFLRSLRGLALPDRRANLALLDPSRGELRETLRALSAVMARARLTPAELTPPTLEPRYVQGAAP